MDKNISGKKCVLIHIGPPNDVEGFSLRVGDMEVLSGPDARKLSEWALREGAAEVKWDFDLKLTDR